MGKILEAKNIKLSDIPAFTALPAPHGFRGKKRYNSQVCAFDIETTTIDEIQQAVMYLALLLQRAACLK